MMVRRLGDDRYRVEAPELPGQVMPSWLTKLIIGAAIGAVLIGVLILGGPMDEVVAIPGEVRPERYENVYPRLAGVLAEVTANEGDTVTKGQVLARLDDGEARLQADALEAELAQAEAELAAAVAVHRRAQAAPEPSELRLSAGDQDLLTQALAVQRDLLKKIEEFDRNTGASALQVADRRLAAIAAELSLHRAQSAAVLLAGDLPVATLAEAAARERAAAARVEVLRRRLARQQDTLARHVLLATCDGIILGRALRHPGERVEQGEIAFRIAVGGGRRISLTAGEDRIDRIHQGALVRFRSRANPDRLVPMSIGHVISVAPDRELSAAESSTRPYAVEVAIDRGPAALPYGSRVDAEVVIRSLPLWRRILLRDRPSQ